MIKTQQRIRQAFANASSRYAQAATLQREVCERLVERLQDVQIKPQRILDIGAGTGTSTQALQQLYPKAEIVALDFAQPMLQQLRQSVSLKHRLFGQQPLLVCADAASLPFNDASFDLVLSNLTLQWCGDLAAVLREVQRVMTSQAVFMFATLGVSTLNELRQCWAGLDQYNHVNNFIELHDLGDAILQAGYKDPVVDIDNIIMRYPDVKTLLHGLKAIGANTVTAKRLQGLMGKKRFASMQQAYEQFKLEDKSYPATFEVIYGLAWGRQQTELSDGAPLEFVPREKVLK